AVFLKLVQERSKLLENANLRGAILSDMVLKGARLSGADLSNAKLNGASLMGANLSRANLTDADVSGTTFTVAMLVRARLIRTLVDGADFRGSDQTGMILNGVDTSRAYGLEQTSR